MSIIYFRSGWRIWAGLGFEMLCLKHVDKIKSALGSVLRCAIRHSVIKR